MLWKSPCSLIRRLTKRTQERPAHGRINPRDSARRRSFRPALRNYFNWWAVKDSNLGPAE